jgi:hydroxymethylglutaryl-CoA lyase
LQGFQRARAAEATEVAVFTAASEQFCKKNTNCSIQDSLKRIEEVIAAAKDSQVAVRGYVSCVVGCPYQVSILLLTLHRPAAAVCSSHCQLAASALLLMICIL